MTTGLKTTLLTADDDAIAAMLARAAQEGAAAAVRALQAEGRLGPVKAPVPSAERTIGELYEEWIPTLGEEAQARRRSHARYLRKPFRHRGQELVVADLKPSEATEAVLISWQQMLGTCASQTRPHKKLEPSTVKQIRMSLQSCFKYAMATKEIATNPLWDVPNVAGHARSREGYLTPQEVERYADNMPPVGSWIVRHMFATGCRVSNILNLRKSQIDWGAKELVLVVKGGRQKRVIVPDHVIEEMRHLCAASPGPWVYPSPRSSQSPVPYDTFRAWTVRARKKTGISPAGEPMVSHHVRHGTAVDMIDNGADITEVQAQLTHANIKQTEIYARMRGAARDRLRARQNARFAK